VNCPKCGKQMDCDTMTGTAHCQCEYAEPKPVGCGSGHIGHWQNPEEVLPDDELTVLVRVSSGGEVGILPAHRLAEKWLAEDGFEVRDEYIAGWIHIDDAVRVLDGGGR
jgi:hypothetical protein